MKAALKAADGRFTIEEVEEPALTATDWVKARVDVAGICGTDLRHWQKPDPHSPAASWGTSSLAKWSKSAPT